ncbi:MAG: tetrahydrodipicolinate N-succinyltransferase N-terminal domain-containing protein [Patescibacteria group bacterium]
MTDQNEPPRYVHPATLNTVDDFKAFVASVQAREGYKAPLAFALGFATVARDGTILDTYYPTVNMTMDGKLENAGSAAIFADAVNHLDGSANYLLNDEMVRVLQARFAAFKDDGKVHANIEAVELAASPTMMIEKKCRKALITFIGAEDADKVACSTPDAYLRLHLLSHRKVRPNQFKETKNIFMALPNVAWTSDGPMLPQDAKVARHKAMASGNQFKVYHQDKFPHILDYVALPDSIRIGDGARVRLGAYLGDGTTVMQEGFINFNAGDEGPAMVEGRISQGVFITKNSDVGGGASIMGTLSGGGNEIISIGENCLLGANSGIGISLGDRCTIEAGLYVTDRCKVYVDSPSHLAILKDRGVDFYPGEGYCVLSIELTGMDDMLFIRDSRSGRIVLKTNKNPNKLNAALHAPPALALLPAETKPT